MAKVEFKLKSDFKFLFLTKSTKYKMRIHLYPLGTYINKRNKIYTGHSVSTTNKIQKTAVAFEEQKGT